MLGEGGEGGSGWVDDAPGWIWTAWRGVLREGGERCIALGGGGGVA